MNNSFNTSMKKRPLLWYFILAYAISWLIWLPGLLSALGLMDFHFDPSAHTFLGAIGPILALVIVTAVNEGGDGVRKLFTETFRQKGRWAWLLGSLLVPLVLMGLAMLLLMLSTGSWQDISTRVVFPNLSLLLIFVILVLAAIGEDIGWRGYALTRFQETYHPFIATLILTVLWLGWHIPTFFFFPLPAELFQQMGLVAIFPTFFSFLIQGITYTWVMNRSGSVLAVALVHAGFNIGSSVATQETGGLVLLGFLIFALLVAIVSKARLGVPKSQNL